MTDEVLSRRYRLVEHIGSGGFSTVYRGEDLILDKPIAVKVLARHLSEQVDFLERFRREARAVAKLNHPNVVQIYDAAADGDRFFLVMELVEGGVSCAEMLHGSSLSPNVALEIVAQAARGLDYAHQRGVIHRDVKPGNLMVVQSSAEVLVKVTDFGIASAGEWQPLGQWEPMIGTRGYLCPEAWWDQPVTPQFDIYALGVVAHQLLFGGLPVRDGAGAIMLPAGVGDAAASRLRSALGRALADDPTGRPANCCAFAETLRDAYAAGRAEEPKSTQ